MSEGSMPRLVLEFCGEAIPIPIDEPFAIGRDADYVIDENPYLHRRFVEFSYADGLWWAANVGTQISATISDEDGRLQAWLAPGARMPIVFAGTTLRFAAGATSYEVVLMLEEALFSAPTPIELSDGTTTLGGVTLTVDQRKLIVALAEPQLRRDGSGSAVVPSSGEAAARLGWAMTKFNRKLDNVCAKLTKAGVRGLHGGPGMLASNRRARLVEYAIAVRLVTPDDLPLLDELVVDSGVAPGR